MTNKPDDTQIENDTRSENERGREILIYHKNRGRIENEIIKATVRAENRVEDKKIYTLGGEIFNSITHGVTALASIAVLVICIVIAATHDLGTLAVLSVTVYGITAFLGFGISTVYHALAINRGKRVMRVLDHCSIYFIIAGTYTPFSLIGIGGAIGWIIFGANWTLCALGTTLTAVDRERFKKFAFVCYLVMGWMAVLAVVPLINGIGFGASLCLLFGGGMAYTIGAYVFKQKGKYVHGIWHLFTFVGLVAHFFAIVFLMI